MKDFTYCLPTRFVFGHGAEKKAGAELAAMGARRVLIHFGGGSAVRSGLIDRLESGKGSLEDAFKDYEKGMKLVKSCNEKIEKIEKQVQVLSGEPAEEKEDVVYF